MWPYSCTARISPHPRCCPNDGPGDGGVGQRKITGPSSSGTAKPFETLDGSSTITVTRAVGALPTIVFTDDDTDSMRSATGTTHVRISAGKWNRKCAVSIVSHLSAGRVRYWAAAGVAGARTSREASTATAVRIDRGCIGRVACE
jgi:hypothetical protein